jgi:hypothetical protein
MMYIDPAFVPFTNVAFAIQHSPVIDARSQVKGMRPAVAVGSSVIYRRPK